MADRVDEFLFRGFVPEENRGGTYHVVLMIGGRPVGPMTPERAEALGWPLPAIMADMNRQTVAELNEVRAVLESERQKSAAKDAELAQANALLSTQAKHIASLTKAKE